MKTPAELAARLRKMVLAAQHHYSPTGEPLRSIVVTPEWLEDMADAANALDSIPPSDAEVLNAIASNYWGMPNSSAPAAPVAQVCAYPDCNCPFDAPADPDWCARGLPHAETAARGFGINKI